MKKSTLLSVLIVLIILPSAGRAQWVIPTNFINFDAADTLWRHAITIDTVHYHNNQWQVGRPHKAVFDSAYSPLNAIVTDTIHPYAPNDTSEFILNFPGHVASWWLALMHFQYKLNIDTNARAYISYSSDSGRTWVMLNGTFPPGVSYASSLADTAGWQSYNMGFNPLILFHNDSVKLKFTLISGNDTTSKAGWMIDNISIDYMFEEVLPVHADPLFTLFPNPTNGDCSIDYYGPLSPDTRMEIVDVLGRQAAQVPVTGSKTTFSTSGLLPGVYDCRIHARGAALVSQKLVVTR